MKNRLPAITAFHILILLPLALYLICTLFSVKAEIRFSNMFYLAALCYFVLSLYKQERVFRMPEPYMWSFFAYFVTIAVSMLWADDRSSGWIILRRELIWLGVPLVFCTFRLEEKHWYLLLNIYFRACLLFVVVSLANWLYFSHTHDIALSQFFIPTKHYIASFECWQIVYSWTSYQHPSYNALGLIIGFIACQMLVRKRKIFYTESILYNLLLAVIVYITQSRIGVVMFATVIAVCPLFFFGENKRYRLVYLICLFALGAGVIVAWLTISSPFSLDHVRRDLYSDAIAGIRQHPLLGVGIGGLPEAINNFKLSNPHNQLFGDWLQSGLPTVAALLTMIIVLTWKAFRDSNGELLLLLIVNLLFMQIEMPFYLIKGINYFVLFTCLFAARPIASKE